MRLTGIRTIVLLAAGLAVGYVLRGSCAGEQVPSDEPGAAEVAQTFTCSMHPQFQLPGPGACPICGMDLIPLEGAGGGATAGDARRLTISPEERDRMRIRTVPVERRTAEAEIRMFGKVAYDETQLSYITAWVPGRIDRLYVDYTGITVNKGDHMVFLFSPLLFGAQEELLAALRTLEAIEAGQYKQLRETASATVDAARERLRLSGLTDVQIAEIEERGEASEHVKIQSPAGGVVIRMDAHEGMYVEKGSRIFTIADLSTLWVLLDAYESDLAWLRYGQPLTFETVAYPGTEFDGTVSFIDPVLDPKTRTVKVRVVVDNTDGRLKPEMFVSAVVRASVTGEGRVMDPSLAGKWISPMHPEIVKDGPGACDVCGMDLVPAETLGYEAAEELEAPLLVPVTAALRTGERAVVYVELFDTTEPTYEGREVVLGPRAGDHYLVRGGLEEGERVVVRGNFKLDSALQILARPSMMNPGPAHEEGVDAHHDHDDDHDHGPRLTAPAQLHAVLAQVWEHYAALGRALAADDADGARAADAELARAFGAVSGDGFDEPAGAAWKRLSSALPAAADDEDIEALRERFEQVSATLEETLRTFGAPTGTEVRKVHCPMAFDGRGASWLEEAGEIANPYYGSSMLRCGAVVETLAEAVGDE